MDVGISGQIVSGVLTAAPCTNGIVPVISDDVCQA